MLHLEFAISPSAVNTLSDLTIIQSRFGYAKGALVSQFPKGWFREVIERLNLQNEMQKKKLKKNLELLRTNR